MALIDLANPTRFLALAERLLPYLIGLTAIAFAIGLYLAQGAPDDYQQGATVRIMFIHVPAAWLCMFVWGVMSVASLGTLVWRHPVADVAAKAGARYEGVARGRLLYRGMAMDAAMHSMVPSDLAAVESPEAAQP